MPEPAHTGKRHLTSTVDATPLMISTTDLGLSIRLSMFELRETGHCDIFDIFSQIGQDFNLFH